MNTDHTTTQNDFDEIETTLETDELDQPSNRWSNPRKSASQLWEKHVSRHFPEEEEPEPEIVSIPVDDLTQGAWNTLKGGVNAIGAIGSYSLLGVKYIIGDSSSALKGTAEMAKDVFSKQKHSEEDT